MDRPQIIRWFGVITALLILCMVTARAEQLQRFGSIYKITGKVYVTDAVNGKKRALRKGDAVNVGELLQSGVNGEAIVRTDDAGLLAIRPNASFKMEQFRAHGDQDDKFSVRIIEGALRMITGWIGVLNKSNYVITTPTSTIGVRGTDHEPYVLTKDLATKFKQPEGTYNKVTRGGTTLEAAGGRVDIEPGQVGFAPYSGDLKSRGLLTVLMPSLLEKVPGFFVPGKFDDELESIAAEDLSQALAKLSGKPVATPPATVAQATLTDMPDTKPEPSSATGDSNAQCNPTAIARDWLSLLDGAIYTRDAASFVRMFTPESRISARVKTTGGNTVEVNYNRDSLAKSTFTALKDLTQFDTRRPSISASLTSDTSPTKCNALNVESLVIETGTRKGATYRLESIETYRLVLRGTHWLAIEATTTQN